MNRLPELPVPQWLLQNQAFMRYLQLLPIFIIYALPTLMLTGIAFLVIGEAMFNYDKFPVKGKTVVITGGSQGMGRGVAKLLSQKGANVVIVARQRQKLEAAKEYIAAAALNPAKQRFHYISADLFNADESTRVIREVTAWNNNRLPDIVWAIAGYSYPKLFLDVTSEELPEMFNANYWTATYLAHATLKAWLAPADGVSNEVKTFDDGRPRRTKPDSRHFIMTSSVAAFIGIAGYSTYAPAKAALKNLHDCLASEMLMYNSGNEGKMIPQVEIHTVFPGTISSPGHEIEQQMKHEVTKIMEKDDPVQTEDEVAAAAVRELEKGRTIFATTWLGSLIAAGGRQLSHRDRVFVDTVYGWFSYFVWNFFSWDLEAKVKKWGRTNGAPQHAR